MWRTCTLPGRAIFEIVGYSLISPRAPAVMSNLAIVFGRLSEQQEPKDMRWRFYAFGNSVAIAGSDYSRVLKMFNISQPLSSLIHCLRLRRNGPSNYCCRISRSCNGVANLLLSRDCVDIKFWEARRLRTSFLLSFLGTWQQRCEL